MSNVFILADFSGDKATKTTAELATAAARIGAVTAVVLAGAGKGAALAATVNQGPIANVLILESDDFAQFGVAASADALANLIKEKSPAAVLIASHAFGKEVAARVAVLTESGIITDAVDVAADATATQSVFGGSTTVHSQVSHGTPIITVRPNSVEADFSASSPATESASANIGDAAKKSKISSSQPLVKGGRPELTEANIVVSGGRGTNGDFAAVEKFADELGAAVGAPARFAIDQYIRRYTSKPYGIFLVNVIGSFIIGLTFTKTDHTHDLFAIGFAGAFTTWSTFMLDIYLGFELKRYREITINLVMSLGFGLAAAYLGLQIAG